MMMKGLCLGLCAAVAAAQTVEVSLDAGFLADLAAKTHYGDPKSGCASDEQSVKVQGLAGDFCSPACKEGACPTDVPSGVTAKPTCALQSTSGSKFCALICSSSSECGTGSCQKIMGVGICTYSESSTAREGMKLSDFHPIVDAINSNADSTWTAAVPTRFGAMSDVGELCGTFLPGHPEYVDLDLPAFEESELFAAVEERAGGLDLRVHASNCSVISKVRDQSACGSCWAFGSTETFEGRRCMATGKDIEFSAADTAGCCSGFGCGFSMGCGGGQPTAALQWMSNYGVVTGGDFGDIGKGTSCKPYPFETCAHHVPPSAGIPTCPKEEYSIRCERSCSEQGYATSYRQDKVSGGKVHSIRTVSGMVAALENGPISVAITVYGDFPTYKSGVYTHQSGQMLGGHAVEVVGYGTEDGTDYWLVKNSWNSEWGDGGYIKMKKGVDECGIESSAAVIDFSA